MDARKLQLLNQFSGLPIIDVNIMENRIALDVKNEYDARYLKNLLKKEGWDKVMYYHLTGYDTFTVMAELYESKAS